jgi:hypothetical protein
MYHCRHHYYKVLLFVLWATLSVRAGAAFEIVQSETPIAEGQSLTETTWRAKVSPGGDYDVIGLHRYDDPGTAAKSVLFYLPGTNMNGELAVMDESHNLWLYLAARGVTVYTLDYRTHAVPNEPVPDLSFMKEWTLDAFVSDAELAYKFISEEEKLPVFVGGFSRGVTYAYALAGRVDMAGLVVLDGSFKSFREEPFDRDKALQGIEALAQWGTVLSRSRGWDNRTEMMRRAWQDPGGPAMGKFDSIGEQVESTLYYAWGPGGLANPVDGISSVPVLAKAMEGYDRTFPMIQNIEGRAISTVSEDPATELDDHFGSMTLPIIYFGATNMRGDNLLNGIYSATKSGSEDVTIHVLENHGHVDVLFGNRASDLVFEPIRQWMKSRVSNGADKES